MTADDPTPNSQTDPIQALHGAVRQIALEMGADPGPNLALEAPKQAAHGDYATNAAMLLTKPLGKPPREIATDLAERLKTYLGDALIDAEIAGPGFINLRMSDDWYLQALDTVAASERYGSNVVASPEKILVEFVSANPTGPMHIGHGRNAAYGDALCRVLEYAGHEVGREFYVNDFGSQIVRFGESIVARAKGEQPPEDGYQGDYIADIAAAIPDASTKPVQEVALEGVDLMIERTRKSLEAIRVRIDNWFSERDLQGDGRLAAALDRLKEQGHIFEHDGAVWLRTTDFGDDKDRVLRRSNGDLTYFATDIAYHADKRDRGFDRLIDVWGADHHGYVARMKASMAALGDDSDALEPVIMQLVNLVEGGERAQMSKRSGDFVTVDDLADDIGVDALRFFLLQRSHDTTIDLDLSLARSQSQDNPVFYVQYAHARICSILGRVQSGMRRDPEFTTDLHDSERSLIRKLLEFPAEIAEAAARRAPHRLTIYSRDLAASFSAFYRDCQVVGAGEGVESFRAELSDVTRRQLAQSLDLLGVESPQSM